MIARFFSHRLGWLAVLVSLGIGALVARTVWTMRDEQWSYYQRTNTNLTGTLAKGLEWSLDAVDLALQKVAIDLRDAQTLEASDFLLHSIVVDSLWRDIGVHSITVLNENGQVLQRLGDGVVSTGQDLSGQAIFQHFAQGRDDGVYIGAPMRAQVSAQADAVDSPGSLLLPVARAVRGHDGVLQGVVLGHLRMQEINTWLSSMNLGDDSGLNLLRTDGLVLTRFPYNGEYTGHTIAGSQNLRHFTSAPHGSFVGKAVLDGKERLYTFQRVGHYPLIVNAAQSTHTIVKDWQRSALELGLFAVMLMAACIGLALLFTRELARREATEADLFGEKERMRLTLQSIGDAVVCTDAQGRITYLNPLAKRITGWTLLEVGGQPIECLHTGPSRAGDEMPGKGVRQALETGEAVERVRTSVIHRATGERFDMDESAAPVFDAKGALQGAVAVLRDVTVAAAQEARLQRLAFHDALTGLPNRLLLHDRAQQALAQAQRQHSLAAVVYVDLDGFKHINDTLGHLAGDAAIVHAARALQSSVRVSDTVCRLGGDEFVVLLTNVTDEEHLHALATKLQQACAQPLQWEGQTLQVHASGGVSLYPVHATEWEALLDCADQAMYAAKQAGRHQMRLYMGSAPAMLLGHAESVPEGPDQTPTPTPS